MKIFKNNLIFLLLAVILFAFCQKTESELACESGSKQFSSAESDFIREFSLDKKQLRPVGENKFFKLIPGYRLTLSGNEDIKKVELEITVLNETKIVNGVETRIVEERETQNGELVEVSRNFFAIHPETKDVYYFGEEVDIYRNGKIVSHEGAWKSGENGAKFGLMMPGNPVVGQKFYQEIAPGVAMDKAEIISLTDSLQTPAGKFYHCLKIEETTPLEKGREYKIFAMGIGLIKDGDLLLVRYGGQK